MRPVFKNIYRKRTAAELSGLARHNGRGGGGGDVEVEVEEVVEVEDDGAVGGPDDWVNSNIDHTRSKFNYSLGERPPGKTGEQQFDARLEEIGKLIPLYTKIKRGGTRSDQSKVAMEQIIPCPWGFEHDEIKIEDGKVRFDVNKDKDGMPIYENKVITDNYFKDFLAEIVKEYGGPVGDKIILSADVHLDEHRPHMHVVWIPLVKAQVTKKQKVKSKETGKTRIDYVRTGKVKTDAFGNEVYTISMKDIFGPKMSFKIERKKMFERMMARGGYSDMEYGIPKAVSGIESRPLGVYKRETDAKILEAHGIQRKVTRKGLFRRGEEEVTMAKADFDEKVMPLVAVGASQIYRTEQLLKDVGDAERKKREAEQKEKDAAAKYKVAKETEEAAKKLMDEAKDAEQAQNRKGVELDGRERGLDERQAALERSEETLKTIRSETFAGREKLDADKAAFNEVMTAEVEKRIMPSIEAAAHMENRFRDKYLETETEQRAIPRKIEEGVTEAKREVESLKADASVDRDKAKTELAAAKERVKTAERIIQDAPKIQNQLQNMSRLSDLMGRLWKQMGVLMERIKTKERTAELEIGRRFEIAKARLSPYMRDFYEAGARRLSDLFVGKDFISRELAERAMGEHTNYVAGKYFQKGAEAVVAVGGDLELYKKSVLGPDQRQADGAGLGAGQRVDVPKL